MDNNNDRLRHQVAAMRQSFFHEGTLDSFFLQLELLEGPDDPNFVEEIFTLYFRNSIDMIAAIEDSLNKTPPDLDVGEKMLCRLKVNSASIGTAKVKEKVDLISFNIKERNLEGMKAALLGLKHEFETLKMKMESYFQLKGQAASGSGGEGAVPPQ